MVLSESNHFLIPISYDCVSQRLFGCKLLKIKENCNVSKTEKIELASMYLNPRMPVRTSH